jgi:hypothetical protein
VYPVIEVEGTFKVGIVPHSLPQMQVLRAPLMLWELEGAVSIPVEKLLLIWSQKELLSAIHVALTTCKLVEGSTYGSLRGILRRLLLLLLLLLLLKRLRA